MNALFLRRYYVITFLFFEFISTNTFSQIVPKPTLNEIVKPVINLSQTENLPYLCQSTSAWGDYNNDGYLDLIISGIDLSGEKKLVLYKNAGNGSFSMVYQSLPQLQNASLVWLDYNNDGNIDLFIAGFDDIGVFTGLFENQGAFNNYSFKQVFEGTFEPLSNGGNNQGGRYAIAGDYDNDGWTDLYIQGKNESGVYAYLYKNIGGLGFEKICPINGLSSFLKLYANSAAFADYNNDGFLDILTAGYSTIADRSTTGAYYKNNGDGTFSDPVLFDGATNGEVAWLDYNNDGRQDFLMTGYSFLPNIGWQGDLFENQGNGVFLKMLPAKTNLSATQDCSIACGDVNNDGYEDVLYIYSHPDALFLNNLGNKTFTRSNLIYSDNGGSNVTMDQTGGMVNLVDFDRDNDLDIFTLGNGKNMHSTLFRNDLGQGISTNAPPSMPENLRVQKNIDNSVSFSWDIAKDDHTPQTALRYNLFVEKEGSNHPMFVLPSDTITGFLKVNENLAAITTNSYKMTGLPDGTYILGVQAIDNGKLTSRFSTLRFDLNLAGIWNVRESELLISINEKACVISSNKEWNQFEIYDTHGALIQSFSGKRTSVQIKNLASGVYIVKITRDKDVIVNKIIL